MTSSVLYVSKPIAPPFHDGSKCLVRDVARHLTRIDPVVLSTPGAPPLVAAPGARPIRMVPAYAAPGGFTPAFSANLRAGGWLLLRSRAAVWHFVFAPNSRTSGAGRWLSRLRGVPVVQTVASPPRSFEEPERLFFGDAVVAQSSWTRRAIESSYSACGRPPPRLFVIPPPVPEVTTPSAEAIARARAAVGLPAAVPYVIYPGDLETSSGARTTAAIAERLTAETDLATVFAYRLKSPRAAAMAGQLQARLASSRTHFMQNAPDILALLAGARAVVFPVDDLWGKVDLPIVLLEAMALGVPVIALDQGPLSDLSGVVKIPSLDADAWLHEIRGLLGAADRRAFVVTNQRQGLERHQASRVARAYEDVYLDLART